MLYPIACDRLETDPLCPRKQADAAHRYSDSERVLCNSNALAEGCGSNRVGMEFGRRDPPLGTRHDAATMDCVRLLRWSPTADFSSG